MQQNVQSTPGRQSSFLCPLFQPLRGLSILRFSPSLTHHGRSLQQSLFAVSKEISYLVKSENVDTAVVPLWLTEATLQHQSSTEACVHALIPFQLYLKSHMRYCAVAALVLCPAHFSNNGWLHERSLQNGYQ